MPIIIECPSCGRQLRVSDEAQGKKVRCPSCKTTFTAAAPEDEAPVARRREPTEDRFEEEEPRERRRRPAARDEDEDEAPRRRSRDEDEDDEDDDRPRRRRGGDWGRVRTGITLVLIAVCLNIAMIVLSFLVGMVIGAASVQENAQFQPGPPGQPPVYTPRPPVLGRGTVIWAQISGVL